MLFRAIAYQTAPYSTPEEGEVVVFFESPSEKDAWPRLQKLLMQAWQAKADHVEAYNIHHERELLNVLAGGDASTGDARLLEIGAGPDGEYYVKPESTLLLVTPRMLGRLVAAQGQVALHEFRKRELKWAA